MKKAKTEEKLKGKTKYTVVIHNALSKEKARAVANLIAASFPKLELSVIEGEAKWTVGVGNAYLKQKSVSISQF